MCESLNSAMLFAAGLGTRMRPLTDQKPKALIEVGGQTMLQRAVETVGEAGFTNIVVNAHWQAQQVKEHLTESQAKIQTEEVLLETGGGLKAALPDLGDPVLTMNTDAIWIGPNPAEFLKESWSPDDQALLLLAARVGTNFTMDQTGKLSRHGDWIYTGAQIIRTKHVADRPEKIFSLNLVWDDLIRAGFLRGIVYPGLWCDVGTPDDIARAEKMLLEHE